ncbi:MAG: 2-isopropylmalate synthase, partial [Spirochaetes bacterium]|nr:2-isopropylmalate synthase [Spirochaetota bacterium]
MQTDTIRILDTTLRDGEQSPGASMGPNQKVEIAKALERIGVDMIEAGFPVSSKAQFDALKMICEHISNPYVVGLARCVPKDVDAVYQATKDYKKRMLHIFIATSPIHMEYKLKKSPQQVLGTIKEMLDYSKQYFDEIEFSAEDASRTEYDFLVEVFKTAINHGATTINVPDTVGYATPENFGETIAKLKKDIPQFSDNVYLSVHCHNDLGLANANALSAVLNGATQVECTINGIGERAGNTALEEFIMTLHTRKDIFHKTTNINKEMIYPLSRMLIHLTGLVPARNKPIIGENVFIHESGIHQDGIIKHRETYEIISPEIIGRSSDTLVLGRHSGLNGFRNRLENLGITFDTEEEMQQAFQRFSDLADLKKEVYDDDLFVILGDLTGAIKEGYTLDYHHINSGNSVIPTATVKLKKGEATFQAASTGDGPVDAIFKAIDEIAKINTRLTEYIVQGVSSGKHFNRIVKVNTLQLFRWNQLKRTKLLIRVAKSKLHGGH